MNELNQTQPPAGDAPRKPRRRFRILLGLSLAFNLLVVGAIVGVVSHGPQGRFEPPNLRRVAAPYVGAFDRETKRAMRDDMRARLPDPKKANRANTADYASFLVIVRSETFDAVRATKIMEAQHARVGNVQMVGRKLAIERISAMSRKDRIAYANRFEERLANKKERRMKKEH